MKILAASALLATSLLVHASGPGPAMRVIRDVAYGEHPLQRMDVYAPDPRPERSPIVAMVHGGAWYVGDKAGPQVVGNKSTRWVGKGWVFVSINHRLMPSADPLTQAEDVARALAAIQKDAASWGGDPEKVVLMGHSSGGHLVALLGANPEQVAKPGAKPWVGTIVLDSAALDVPAVMDSPHPQVFDRVFGSDAEDWKRMSPQHALTPKATPMLLVCSTRHVRSCRQAGDFVDAATKLGVRVETLELDVSHRDVNDTLGLERPYTRRVEAFLGSLDPAFAGPRMP
jgi:acetyl esterase/lipase